MRWLVVLALVSACPSKESRTSTIRQPDRKLLYDRLGGMDAITGIVKDFVEDQLMKDSRLSARFTNVDLPRLEEAIAIQLCAATGGPCKYTGRRMHDAHAGMNIGDDDFSAFVGDLRKTLAKFKVADAEQKELLAIVEKLRGEIVEK